MREFLEETRSQESSRADSTSGWWRWPIKRSKKEKVSSVLTTSKRSSTLIFSLSRRLSQQSLSPSIQPIRLYPKMATPSSLKYFQGVVRNISRSLLKENLWELTEMLPEAWRLIRFGTLFISEPTLGMNNQSAMELKIQRRTLDSDILTSLSTRKISLSVKRRLKVMSLSYIMWLCLRTENIRVGVWRRLDLNQKLLMISLLSLIPSRCRMHSYLRNRVILHMCMKCICLNWKTLISIKYFWTN